jgi:hypothetical protein
VEWLQATIYHGDCRAAVHWVEKLCAAFARAKCIHDILICRDWNWSVCSRKRNEMLRAIRKKSMSVNVVRRPAIPWLSPRSLNFEVSDCLSLFRSCELPYVVIEMMQVILRVDENNAKYPKEWRKRCMEPSIRFSKHSWGLRRIPVKIRQFAPLTSTWFP